MVDEKKFLDQNGVEYLWSQLSLEDYPNNETLIAILNAIDTTKADRDEITNKQNKNVIVYRDSATKKASMTAPQIMEKVRAGDNVYYTTSLSGGTLHPYLEGADTGVFFYSNYIDNNRIIGTGILVSADGTITSETYQLAHLTNNTIHITSAERNRWNDTYTKTETDSQIANLVNSAPETLDTLGELATAIQNNSTVVEALDASITNKQNKIIGTPNDFVVIGEDGLVTTKSILQAESELF